jgi:parallel beta-helix repeat protein
MKQEGWLKADPKPLGTTLGQQISKVETFTNDDGEPVYYIVYLQPSGFVIVSADDLVEPIIGFVREGTYNPSLENPLGALVTNDLNGRVVGVRNTFSPLAIVGQPASTMTQKKWQYFISLGEMPKGAFSLMGLSDDEIDDMRIAALVQTKWSQEYVVSANWPNNKLACYNYYTPPYGDNNPDNFPCGCVATAMAQLIRYYMYPDEPNNDVDPNQPDGGRKFSITVEGHPNWPDAELKGGDGNGGKYKWGLMVPKPGHDPDDPDEEEQRKAIGALCYDAGISVNMNYTVSESYPDPNAEVKNALLDTFKYSNAITAYSGETNIGPGLIGMIHPNLDARKPVILSSWNSERGDAHSFLCDGYGYNYETLYHHLNMGWSGSDDLWYNLPDIDASKYPYNLIDECIYNIFKPDNGKIIKGEIISGRVLDSNNEPAVGNVICLEYEGEIIDTNETDANGIFAFIDVNSNTTYKIWVEGRDFPSREVTTGKSRDGQSISGNRWGIDFPASLQQEILYVDFDATAGNNDGSSWPDAFIDLQDAIEVAAISGGQVKQIWVAEGEYKPDRGTEFRSLSFQLIDGVGIYGGFSGEETRREQRNPHNNETILSGDINDDDGDDFAHNDENSYHVVNGSGTDETAILDGFTIIGGNADDGNPNETYIDDTGAGMFISGGSPRVTNCTFTNNSAEQHGGGMYNQNNSSPTLTDCNFIYNSANNGGSMFNDNSSPTMIECNFTENNATENGGGIYNQISSNPTLTDCNFIGNSANNGGGILNQISSSPTLTDCNFIYNSANYGGSMFNDNSNPTMIDCDFIENNATENGGGIYNQISSNPTLTDCNFSGNSANYGGGILNQSNSSPALTDCDFSGNSANYGGGIHNQTNSSPTLTNCNFIDNSATYGGGMFNDNNTSPSVSNCIFSRNSAQTYGGGIFNNGQSDATLVNCTLYRNSGEVAGAIVVATGGSLALNNSIVWANTGVQIFGATVSYSDIQGGFAGESNIKDNPLFASPDNGDYHLKSQAGRWDAETQSWLIDDVTSPCIDAGDKNNPLEPLPNGFMINMGAYGGTAQASKSPFDTDYISVEHPDYDQWVDVGKPLCWCYRRQCHGDTDCKSQGKQKYWVSTDDLDILIAAWSKPFAEIEGQTLYGLDLVCADFDHKAQGKRKYRVSTNDLDILIANWSKADKPDPNCP